MAEKLTAREEARAVLARVMAGDDAPKRSRTPSGSPKKPIERAHRRSRSESARKYDHQEFKRLYVEEGMTSAAIADKFDCNRKTVVKALTDLGVWKPLREGKGGRPKADFCDRGHDQSVWRRETAGKGDWHCGKCRLDYNKDYKRRVAAKLRDNRIELRPGQDGVQGGEFFYDVIVEGTLVGTLYGKPEVARVLNDKLTHLNNKITTRKVTDDDQ